jgi:glycosyltransferase involved in cell wall biosynthesis
VSPIRALAVIASSDLGGAERALVSFLKGVDRTRIEMWVASEAGGPMLREYRRHAAGVATFDLRRVWNPVTPIRLARWMRQIRCDLVHTHLWTADLIGGLGARLARVPIVVSTVHSEGFRPLGVARWRDARRRGLSRIYRSVYRLADQVIAVSQSIATDLAQRPGVRVRDDRIQIIRNGLDVSRVSGRTPGGPRMPPIPVRGPLVLVVANFVPEKGHRWLVAAMPAVRERFPDVTFALVGAGRELAAIRAHVDAAGLGQTTLFLGAREDALDILAAADVVVLPSLSEGLPLVCLEALALGKPLVATRVGGVPEILEHGETALMVPPGAPEALAEGIVTVLADPGRARALGERGHRVVTGRFSAEQMVRDITDTYLRLATHKEVPR